MTALDPAALDFPSSATGLKGGSWIVSGCSVLKDGRSVLEEYGRDLDQLAEGDRVGIQRDSRGQLHLWVNGQDCGPAASGLPPRLWAVVDLYGKCTQVTVVSCEPPPDGDEDEGVRATSENGVGAEDDEDDEDEEEEEEEEPAESIAASGRAAAARRNQDNVAISNAVAAGAAALVNGSTEEGKAKVNYTLSVVIAFVTFIVFFLVSLLF